MKSGGQMVLLKKALDSFDCLRDCFVFRNFNLGFMTHTTLQINNIWLLFFKNHFHPHYYQHSRSFHQTHLLGYL